MNQQEFEKLAVILSDAFKVPPESIRREALLKEDLGADSLDASVALMDIEDLFDIQVPDQARNYRSVGDIVNHIDELLAAKALTPGPPTDAGSTAQSVGGAHKAEVH